MGDEGGEGGTGVSGAEGQRGGSVLLCELLESAAVFGNSSPTVDVF